MMDSGRHDRAVLNIQSTFSRPGRGRRALHGLHHPVKNIENLSQTRARHRQLSGPSSGAITTVSAFGSGINENQFLVDGTNFTCPCNGIARAEPGVNFIEEVQLRTLVRRPNTATSKTR
jgi:hypothetical protein